VANAIRVAEIAKVSAFFKLVLAANFSGKYSRYNEKPAKAL
jgi:hypothetical protein